MHPPSNTCFLGPTGVHIPFPNGISVGSAVFVQQNESPYTLQLAGGRPFSPQNFCFPGDLEFSGLPSRCFFGPTHNGMSIGSPVFGGLTVVTDRQTMLNNRPHINATQWVASYVRTGSKDTRTSPSIFAGSRQLQFGLNITKLKK